MVNDTEITQNVLSDLKDRLNIIIGYLRQKDPVKYNNQTNISKSLNVQRTNLSAALNGDSRYLKKDSPVVQAIFAEFPELNKDWFDTGSGRMLNVEEDEYYDDLPKRNIQQIPVSEFEALPIVKQLSLIWETLLQLNHYLDHRVSSQDDKLVKIMDYIEDNVTPMYDYIKMKENKDSL